MNVEDVIRERIAAARWRAEEERRRRRELAEARRRGLAARHAQKLRNLAARQAAEDNGEGEAPVITP